MRAPKRRRPLVRRMKTPPGIDLAATAEKVSYIGSPEHKDTPSFAGHARPRRDASICPRELADDLSKVESWLRAAIRRGAVNERWESNYPRYVWFKQGERYTKGGWSIASLVNTRATRSSGTNGRPVSTTSMSDLRFDFDWDDPLGARGDELRATWARLRMSVNGEPVTRVLTEGAKTVREHVSVPLYPLAEWLATHWWVLCHEWGTPERVHQPEFRSRHSLVAAREGYSLPPLSFQSQGEVVRLEWEAERLPHHHVEFLSRGHAYLPLTAFQQTVSDFLEAVVARLEELGVGSTLLAEEWAAIVNMDAEEREFCRS